MATRTRIERIGDVLERLATEPNVWVATASPDGVPHLVPLSLAWIDERVVVSTPAATPTARNAAATGRARLSLDSADDVAIIDAAVTVVDLDAADPELVAVYAGRVGWDPRHEAGAWSLLTLTPLRVQAWSGVDEISGRTLMRNGEWLR
jgi:hypothetical protein